MTIALVGANWHGIKRELDALVGVFMKEHGDLALERIDASEVAGDQIFGAVESLPFLATKKMVVAQDLSLNKEASEKLEQLIERAGDTTELIIVESKLDKRSVYYKNLKKLTDFKEFSEPDENTLAQWLVTEAKQKNGSLALGDARYLVQRVGANQTALSHELEKLLQYDPKVTRSTIELLTDETPSSTVFNLIDRAFGGDIKGALKLYEEQRAQKVEPQALHAMLVWQMHVVALCARAGDKNSPEITADSGISPFVVGKGQMIARRMGLGKIKEFLDLLRDIDYQSKNRTLDYDEALRFVIVTLSK